jgi:hypothetical protein
LIAISKGGPFEIRVTVLFILSRDATGDRINRTILQFWLGDFRKTPNQKDEFLGSDPVTYGGKKRRDFLIF